MQEQNLTDAELMLLGLTAEMPRHGYELEQVIEERGMREWASIGFSSIYFVLSKLEKRSLVKAAKPKGAKAKKLFTVTPTGQTLLVEQSLYALETLSPNTSSLLLGMLHWPFVPKHCGLAALARREKKLADEIDRLGREQLRRQPLPDYVEAIFEHAKGQLSAEAIWVEKTKAYFTHRIEHEGDDDGI